MKATLLLVCRVALASAVARLTEMPAITVLVPRAEITHKPAVPNLESCLNLRYVQLDQDHWECATEDMIQYFDMPKPTGALFNLLVLYGQVLTRRICSLTGPESLCCPRVENSEWCGFTTWAPSTMISEFSSHASKASSWSAAHSSGIAVLPTDCPNYWNYAKMRQVDGERWLNFTLAWAECYAREHLQESVIP
jgi:hypothetical protein